MKSARCGVRPLLYLMACLMGFASPAAAQFGVGSIGGTVTDGSGGVLPGVTVTLSNPGVIGGEQTAVTDVDGTYQFARLVPGSYTIKGELQGFRSFVQEKITVNADRTSRVDLKLEVGNVAETVTVSGQAPLLDTTSALNQTVLPRETLDTLPTGYDTWSIARLAPAVHLDKYDVGGREMFGQSNASAHGSTEREYFIDGMDLNQYGGTFYIDSFAFQEVNIQTANMSAERSTGGVVWMFVTKTGSNQFHGTGAFLGMAHGCCEADNINAETEKTLLAAVPPYALAADPTPSLGNSVEHMYDLSGTVGGPIIKDRLWFTFAGKLGEVYQRRVGSYNADGTQLLSDNQLRQTTAKVSYAINQNQQLHYVQSWVHKGRYHVAGGPNVTEFFSNEATTLNPARHWFHLARWTNVLSQKSVLDVGVSFAYGNNHLLPQPEVQNGDIAKFDAVTRINTGARRTYQWQPGNRGNIHTSFSYFAGNHDMKVGWQYIRSDVSSGVFLTSNYPAGLNAIFRNGVPDSVNTYNAPNESTRSFYTNGIYFQDQWRPHKKLTVNIGLRYENAYGWLNDGESPLCFDTNVFVQGACFAPVKGVPDFHAFVPRLSMIYDLLGNGRTALKFSINRYKDRVTETYLTRINPIGNASDTRTWTDNGDKIPQLNELGPTSGFNVGTTNRYADDLKWPTTNEFDVEVEQELGKVVVGAGYFYRAYRDVIGQKNEAVPTSSYIPLTVTEVTTGKTVSLYNQDPNTRGRFDTVFFNTAEMNKTFHGFDIHAQKRMSNHWMLMSSLAYGHDIGSSGGDLNNPNNAQYRIGVATAFDVPWFFKLAGTYEMPWGINASGSYQFYTGWPETTVVRVASDTVRLTQTNQNVIIEPRGTVRMDKIQLADVSFKKSFTMRGSGMRLEPRLDIYNILNAATVNDRIQQLGPSYHNVIDLLGARMIKLGANVNW
jgi:Carboxypeptidase regulatory-like domain/TonB dependent receptor-like, beta-barrel